MSVNSNSIDTLLFRSISTRQEGVSGQYCSLFHVDVLTIVEHHCTSAPLFRFLSSVVVSDSTALLADVLDDFLTGVYQHCKYNKTLEMFSEGCHIRS